MFIIYSCIYIYMRTMGLQYSCLITEPILWAGPGMKHQTTSWGGFSTSWAQAHWPAWVIPNHPLWVFSLQNPPKKNPTKNHVPSVFDQFISSGVYVIYEASTKMLEKSKKTNPTKMSSRMPQKPRTGALRFFGDFVDFVVTVVPSMTGKPGTSILGPKPWTSNFHFFW